MGRDINLLNIKDRIQMLRSHDHRRYKAERHRCVRAYFVTHHNKKQNPILIFTFESHSWNYFDDEAFAMQSPSSIYGSCKSQVIFRARNWKEPSGSAETLSANFLNTFSLLRNPPKKVLFCVREDLSLDYILSQVHPACTPSCLTSMKGVGIAD
jgi:hypothetical protein